MRSALTMIELIFVIIILGVLAAVALPKLGATRDDAKIVVLSQQAQRAVGEILETYAATGVIKKPHLMSRILRKMVYTGYAAETSTNPIAGSIGQLSLFSEDGTGGNDHPFVIDINQTMLVFRHGTPCSGVVCKKLQQRVAEGNYSIGSSSIIF